MEGKKHRQRAGEEEDLKGKEDGVRSFGGNGKGNEQDRQQRRGREGGGPARAIFIRYKVKKTFAYLIFITVTDRFSNVFS